MTYQFLEAMAAYRLTPCTPVIADGQIRRAYVEGDRKGKNNGWSILFPGEFSVGVFGNWKTGLKQTWCSKSFRTLSPAEKRIYKQRQDIARKAQQAEQEITHERARLKANYIWQSASHAPDNHPYLAKKGVRSCGLRVKYDKLIIPLRDAGGVLHSLQSIDPEGEKRFLSGGKVQGCYFAIGRPGDTLCIAEGYATAASIYMATDYAVAVAFNAGNLLSVSKVLRCKFPIIKMIICADNDCDNAINIGVEKAREAAIAVGGYLCIPEVIHG